MNIKFSKEVSDFIVNNASMVDGTYNRYFYMPWWYKEVEPGIYEQLEWEDLPEDIKDEILRLRESDKHPDYDYPLTENEVEP